MKKERESAPKKQKIIGWIVIAVIVALTIIAIVGNIVNYKFTFASLFNLFPVLMICVILCVIVYMSAIKNFFAGAAKAQNEQKFEFNKKGFLIGLLLFVVCAAASSPLWILGSKEISKTHSPSYVKTEAVVTSTTYDDGTEGLVFVYYDENGNQIVSNGGGSFGGISFKEGQKVTIYYNKQNPHLLVNLGTAVLEFCGALFFVLGGLIAFLANMELHKFIPILFCLTFMCFSAGILAGTMISNGMNLWQVYTGGALGFACTLFFLIGFALLIPSVIDFVKIVRNTIKSKREQKQIDLEYKDVKSKYIDTQDYDKKIKVKKVRKPRVKYKHKFFSGILPLIFAGLIFLGGGGLMFTLGVIDAVNASAYVKCEATVTDLRTWQKNGDWLGCAIYTYEVDGVEYTQESTYSQSAELLPEIGKKVTISYNKNDPTDIKDGNWISYVNIFVALIPIGVGVGLITWAVIMTRVRVPSKNDTTEM